jgi:polysaccharide export outer membrane protein
MLVATCALAAGAHANEQQDRFAPAGEPLPAAHKVSREPIGIIQDTYQLDAGYGSARYRLAPSDVLAISFPHMPAFNQTVTIEPDGFATMAHVGAIHLAGLTADEALASIQSAYALKIDEPMVILELKNFKRPYFIVSGEVRKPGKYDLRGYTSITEALATAGGFNEFAKRSSVLLFRRAGDEWYAVKTLNLKKLLEGREVNEDVEIRAGDMIVVPASPLSKIRRMF